jgi:phosphate transport system permease protein
LLLDVAVDGIGRLDWGFIQGTPSRRAALAGIKPALIGSLYLMGLTALLSLPLGVGAAIYLEEYGRRSRLAGIIEVAIANLAGVPSVIYGLLGLGLFVRAFGMGPSLLAGASTLALLVLPVVIMSSREALRTVPDSLREAALGLGATRWQMIQRVIVPMCMPGILTGAILAISRAIGETMIVAIASGQQPRLTGNPLVPIETMTTYIVQVSMGDTPQGTIEYRTIFAVGMLLFLGTFSLNLVSTWLRERYREEYS